MVHFTCDCCGKEMPASGEPRFVVRIAAFAGFDPDALSPGDLDEDHVEAVSELLQQQENLAIDDADLRREFRFDLCPECHARYIKDPLNRDIFPALNFSKN